MCVDGEKKKMKTANWMEISAWKRVQKSFIRSAQPISTFLEIYFQETAASCCTAIFTHLKSAAAQRPPAHKLIHLLIPFLLTSFFFIFL